MRPDLLRRLYDLPIDLELRTVISVLENHAAVTPQPAPTFSNLDRYETFELHVSLRVSFRSSFPVYTAISYYSAEVSAASKFIQLLGVSLYAIVTRLFARVTSRRVELPAALVINAITYPDRGCAIVPVIRDDCGVK